MTSAAVEMNGAVQDDANLSEDSESTQNSDLDYDLNIDVILPDNTVHKTILPASKPWIDARTQLLLQYKLSPSSHLVDYITTVSGNKKRKASRAIGRMDITMVTIQEKNAISKPVVTPRPASNPKETTVRLLVRLARLRQSIMRVNPEAPLSSIFNTMCEKLKLTDEARSRVEFRHPVQNDVTLNLNLSLNQYNLREVYLAEKTDSKPPNTKTAPPPPSRTKRKAPAPPPPAQPAPTNKSTPVQTDTKADKKPKPAKRRVAPPPPQASTSPGEDDADKQEANDDRVTVTSSGAEKVEDVPDEDVAVEDVPDEDVAATEQDVVDRLDAASDYKPEVNTDPHSPIFQEFEENRAPDDDSPATDDVNVVLMSKADPEKIVDDALLKSDDALKELDDVVEAYDEPATDAIAAGDVVTKEPNNIVATNPSADELESEVADVDVDDVHADDVHTDDDTKQSDDVASSNDDVSLPGVDAMQVEDERNDDDVTQNKDDATTQEDNLGSGMQYGDITVYDIVEDGDIVEEPVNTFSSPVHLESSDDLPPPPPALLDEVLDQNDVIRSNDVHKTEVEVAHLAEDPSASISKKLEKGNGNTGFEKVVATSGSPENESPKQLNETDKTAMEIEKLHQQIKKMKSKNSIKQNDKSLASKSGWQAGSQSFTFVPNKKRWEASHADFDVAPVGGIELSNSGDFKALHENTNQSQDTPIIQQAPKLRSTLPSYYKKFLGANAFAAKGSSAK